MSDFMDLNPLKIRLPKVRSTPAALQNIVQSINSPIFDTKIPIYHILVEEINKLISRNSSNSMQKKGGTMGFWTGNKDKITQQSTLTGGQEGLLSSLLQALQGMQGPGGNYDLAQQYNKRMLSGSPEDYERFAAPYKTEFQEQTLPGIAERFAGLGGGMGGGTMGSSGFGQALGGAANQFQSNLANLYAQIQQNAAGQAMNQFNTLGNLGLGTRSFENIYQPGSTGALGGLLSGFGQGAGMGLGMLGGQGIGKGVSAFANMFGKGTPAGGGTSGQMPFRPMPGV